MALTHFYLAHHTGGTRNGGGGRAARYLERTGEFAAPEAAALVGYNARTSSRTKDYDDLQFREVANLPKWAQGDAQVFFEASAHQERMNGRWATSIQASLPRELSLDQQVELTRAFVAAHLPHRPTLWVIHEPITKSDHLPQPHAHMLFSERLMQDGIEREPAQMFRRYNAADPARGGAPKAIFGEGDRQAPYRLREAWCATVNYHLDLRHIEGAELDPRSRYVRGLSRKAVHYVYREDDLRKLDPITIDERTPADRAREQQLAQAWWADYKRTMGLTPGMDQTTVLQIIATEVRQPGTRAQQLAQERTPERSGESAHAGVETGPFIGNIRSKIYHAPGDPNYGDVQPKNQILFLRRVEAEEAGYRAAVNQHYGPGGRERLQAEHARVSTDLAQADRGAMGLQKDIMLTRGRNRQQIQERTQARAVTQALGGFDAAEERRGIQGPRLDTSRGQERDGYGS